MKLMKFINTRLLVAFGVVLAYGLMCGQEVRGGTCCPTGPILSIKNSTGSPIYVNISCGSSNGYPDPNAGSGYNVIFSVASGGTTYNYQMQAPYYYSQTPQIYFQKNQVYNGVTDATYNEGTTHITVTVSLDSSGNIKLSPTTWG